SIDAQLRAISEYCKKEQISILKVFKDEAFSARTDKRPAFQELFGLIKEQPADFLVVHKLDRFARSRADAAFYRSKLKEAGMKLVSVLERLDDSPESIIMEGILESMNEYYSANLSRETKKGLKENILNGKRNGGKVPYGYSLIDHHLVPNKDADTVRRIFHLYSEGMGVTEIVKKTRSRINNIRPLLMNEVYLGHLISGENRCENAHEPIIDKETFYACQKRMQDKRMNAANRAKVDYMLAGLITCGVCGKRMIGMSSKGKYYYYSCKTAGCKIYRKDDLEERVIKELDKRFTPTDEIKALFFDMVSKRVNSRVEDDNARKAEYILRQRITKLIDSVQYAETQDDIKAIMEKVNELRRQMPEKVQPKQTVSREECDRFIESFCDIESMDRQEQRLLLRKTIEQIAVKPDEICLFMSIKRGVCIVINE
ncbi:MAG: recombinase family protein, partial [Paludibacteraceae bacterium]|nr:recombinase family protein [Paludibacteraceae bacterium]